MELEGKELINMDMDMVMEKIVITMMKKRE